MQFLMLPFIAIPVSFRPGARADYYARPAFRSLSGR